MMLTSSAVLSLLILINHVRGDGLQIPALYIFGDSTVDVGNNDYIDTIAKANFPPYGRDFDTKSPTGRFSNGRVATDYFASLSGLPFPPAYLSPEARTKRLLKGVNFASSGSGIYPGTSTNLNLPTLDDQLSWFRDTKQRLIQLAGDENATSIISQALFALSSGTNDYVSNYYLNPTLRARYSKSEFKQLLMNITANFVEELYQLGARRISLISLTPIGCLPSQVTLYSHEQLKCVEFLNQDARDFNQALLSNVHSLRSRLHGLKLAYIDLYTLLSTVLQSPAKYGFQQTLTACCGTGRLAVSILCNELTPGTCSDASKYVFWDSFHTTDAMNKIVAKESVEISM